MRALTPRRVAHPDEVSPLTPPCLPDIPPSTTLAVPRSLCPSPQRRGFVPGFATNELARHSLPPNQVRHPTDCQLTSGCSPPRLAATQSPSITELRQTPERTLTVLSKRPHGRTRPRAGGDPVLRGFSLLSLASLEYWVPGQARD